jgi:V-type H+-transporting ATPase subunit E
MDQKDVSKQITNMMTFIKQEAIEKANEIDVQAFNEMHVLTSQKEMVEKEKLQAEFDKKQKQIETQQKIAYSNALNNARLTTLRARQDCVGQVNNEARLRLAKMGEGSAYKELLQKLIAQALLKLMEKEVLVHCREADQSVVETALPSACATFEKLAGFKCSASVAKGRFLPATPSAVKEGMPSCCGGVVVSAHMGRIMCSNTLDSRLEQVYEKKLPKVREALFGKSTLRTHFD